MAADSRIGFDLDNIRPPTKCNCWSEVDPQIWSWWDLYSFGDIASFIFCRFGLKLLIHAHFLGGCGGIFPPNDVTYRPDPQKALSHAETRRLSHKAWKSVQRFDLGAFPRKKERDSQTKKSQSDNNSPLWREAATVPIRTKICMVGSPQTQSRVLSFKLKLLGVTILQGSNFPFSYWCLHGPYNSAALLRCLW